jgi:hypothetical protein
MVNLTSAYLWQPQKHQNINNKQQNQYNNTFAHTFQ